MTNETNSLAIQRGDFPAHKSVSIPFPNDSRTPSYPILFRAAIYYHELRIGATVDVIALTGANVVFVDDEVIKVLPIDILNGARVK